ncbi:hypothetical protein VTK73DRAFT_1904 [Phialemonium thermophilum]|uniref:CBM1 domain-containing protein n=1 Tax=Phialemonium thermophilum TaxID=223376 RepID=A0ABR3Y316_9PEZI
MKALAGSVLAQVAAVSAGTILWDGRFNDLSSSEDLNNWSWSNQVGPYQYYIHGPSAVTAYVNLSPSYKNPDDTGSNKGAKITLDSTAYWNGQNMRRTELIPQTTAPINQGKVFYHFSLKRSATNPPATTREHQIAFFESHFTEMKAGWISGEQGTSDPLLRWNIGGNTFWNVTWEADVWHNVAYEIDFSANTVGFWHSTGGDPLVQTVAPRSASTSSNGADWHVGVLELPRDGYSDTTEDLYWSGVYIEIGSITTSVSGPGSGGSNPPGGITTTLTTSTTTLKPTTGTTSTTTSTTHTTSPTPGGCTASHWAQCGGNGYSGCTVCEAPYTCKYSNDWYSQCL